MPNLNEPNLPSEIGGFLIKEFECAWSLFRTNYEIRDRWVRYYFLSIGAVLGILGVFANSLGGIEKGINPHLNSILWKILLMVLIFGVAIFLYDIALRFSRREIYYVLNLIRRAFLDQKEDIRKYVLFPVDPPMRLFGWRDWVPSSFLLLFISINAYMFLWLLTRDSLFSLVGAIILFLLLIWIFIFMYQVESGWLEKKLGTIGWSKEDIRQWKKLAKPTSILGRALLRPWGRS